MENAMFKRYISKIKEENSIYTCRLKFDFLTDFGFTTAFVSYKDTTVKTPYMRSYSPPISVMVWEKANKRKNKMFGGGGESAVRERGVPANQTSLSSHVTSLGTTAQTTSSKHPQLQNRGAKFKGRIKMNMRQLENTHPLDGQILPSTQG